MDAEQLFATALRESPATLSAAGEMRRAALRTQLTGTVIARRRRRQAAKFGAAAVALLVAALWWWPEVPVATTDSQAAQAMPSTSAVAIEWLRNDPGVLARHSVGRRPLAWTATVDDEQLLALLAEAGRATGLVRIEGQVRLTAAVTDSWGE